MSNVSVKTTCIGVFVEHALGHVVLLTRGVAHVKLGSEYILPSFWEYLVWQSIGKGINIVKDRSGK